MLNIISLGAGVQSTTMALMAAFGEIKPMPDYAIFADTQWEPEAVYTHLAWLKKQLPFPVITVTKGDIRLDTVEGFAPNGARAAALPFFVDSPNGGGMGMRQCTNEYKIAPIHKKLRELIGLVPRERAPKSVVIKQWIGISTDEAMRAKPSRTLWVEHRFPLLDMGINRRDCLTWFGKHFPGRVLAKSACIGCPFHNDGMWRDMKLTDPVSFQDAVEFDRQIRVNPMQKNSGRKWKYQQYLHRSLKPLGEVDFSTMEDLGQLNMFNNECEGMCGV